MKRVTLEVGGKGPTIILDDADLDTAIPMALDNGLMNSGQACIAGTRILARQRRLDEILARLGSELAAVRIGQPIDPDVRIGPLVSQKHQRRRPRPSRPFGGFKQSGIGRECGSFGLDALLEPRAVLA